MIGGGYRFCVSKNIYICVWASQISFDRKIPVWHQVHREYVLFFHSLFLTCTCISDESRL